MAEVSDDIKNLVSEIIKKYELKPTAEISYGPGSEIGDGFMSRTYTVNIADDDNKSLNLFLKCAIDVKIPGSSVDDVFANEIYFYEVIVPTFIELLEEKGIKDGFQNVPKCYGSVSKKIVALENLKTIGYELCDKNLVGNEQHIELVFKTFAKFHAISFAYKDQKRQEYDKIAAGVIDFFRITTEFNQQRIIAAETILNKFFKGLDAKKDKFILDQSEHLKNKLIERSKVSFATKDADNSVITQGDCWCNNMMFRYEGNKRYPSNVMLIDWQAIRADTPVLDLSYFFYTAAASSKQTLRKIDDFLEIYHEELSNHIRKLGSDPEVLYPLPVLKKEWQTYCSHGYITALLILQVMLGEKEDMPNFEGKDVAEGLKNAATLLGDAHQDEYTNRLRNLAQHFLLNEFL